MQLIIYPLLNLRSQRSLVRNKEYIPRYHLSERLKEITGLSDTEIIEQCQKEGEFLRKNGYQNV